MKAGIKTRIDPASRALWIAKSKGVEAKLEPEESKRYDLALDCLASFMQMIEKSCEMSDDVITKTFHGCDRAWKEFIRHCPSVIDGHKPTDPRDRVILIEEWGIL